MGFLNPGADSWGRTRGLKKHQTRKFRAKSPPRSQSAAAAAVAVAATPAPKASLTSLPTELLHAIFLLAPTPGLPRACRTLATVIAGRHLQLQYVRQHCSGAARALARVAAAPWFTLEFLHEYEARYGVLAADAVELPPPLLERADAPLVAALVARGARWGSSGADAVQDALERALERADEPMLRALLDDPGVVVGRPAMRAAMRGWSVEWFERLAARGGDVRDVGVWRAALEDGGAEALEWLIGRGPPPGEVLGEVMMAGMA